MRAADLFSLSGRTALVTGASSGIGARFARVLAANGAAVALVARRSERIEQLAAAIRAEGGRAVAIAADVVDREAIAPALDAVEAALGTVDILCANAGIAPTASVLKASPEHWRQVLDVNLDAVWFWGQAVAQRLAAAGKPGSIVNTASLLGYGAGKGVAAYAVSKAAVIQLTRAMALELARRDIRVNAIAPGWVVTEINEAYLSGPEGQKLAALVPMHRFGREEDLDGVLLLLASDAGRYITGATMLVDGGMLSGLREP